MVPGSASRGFGRAHEPPHDRPRVGAALHDGGDEGSAGDERHQVVEERLALGAPRSAARRSRRRGVGARGPRCAAVCVRGEPGSRRPGVAPPRRAYRGTGSASSPAGTLAVGRRRAAPTDPPRRGACRADHVERTGDHDLAVGRACGPGRRRGPARCRGRRRPGRRGSRARGPPRPPRRRPGPGGWAPRRPRPASRRRRRRAPRASRWGPSRGGCRPRGCAPRRGTPRRAPRAARARRRRCARRRGARAGGARRPRAGPGTGPARSTSPTSGGGEGPVEERLGGRDRHRRVVGLVRAVQRQEHVVVAGAGREQPDQASPVGHLVGADPEVAAADQHLRRRRARGTAPAPPGRSRRARGSQPA